MSEDYLYHQIAETIRSQIMQGELLSIWRRTRKTVLFITQQIDEAVFLSDQVIVFGSRPGRVKDSLAIPFERPRQLTLKRSPKFLDYLDRIWGLIESDVRSAAGLVACAGHDDQGLGECAEGDEGTVGRAS